MNLPKNEVAWDLAENTDKLPGESGREFSRRLSELSGGAFSPAAFRRILSRLGKKKRGESAYARKAKPKKGRISDPGGKVVRDERQNDMVWSYDGSANITNLAEALAFSKVDLDVWEVDRHVFNTWTTTTADTQKWNVQVKVWFKRRADHGIDWVAAIDEVSSTMKRRSPKAHHGSGTGVICTADFHLGAYIDDLIRSDAFNIGVLVDYLSSTADIINSKGYSEVHAIMLGDFIESFTGLNHQNSWKGLGKGMFGMNAVILCSEILSEFLAKINNLKAVYLVSGNHDRVTSDKDGDQKGEVGTMLHYLLSKSLTVEVKYHHMIITEVIDGIAYVMTHGHLPFSKKDPSKILFDYGKQGVYNVLLQGHTHARQTKKTTRSRQMTWNDRIVVHTDEVDYRVLTAPPMFTGNFFSESLGYSSSAGFLEIQNNGKGRPNVFDYCL